jgi:hypothetical protein
LTINGKIYINDDMKVLCSLLIVFSLFFASISAQAAYFCQEQNCCSGKVIEKTGGETQDSHQNKAVAGDCVFHCATCSSAVPLAQESVSFVILAHASEQQLLDEADLKDITLSEPTKPPKSV